MQGTIERGVYGTATEILNLADGVTAVVYQDTAVVKFTRDYIILTAPESAKTQTTKLRMNQASYQWDLGYYVTKRNGKWYVYKSTVDDEGKLKPTTRICEFNDFSTRIERNQNS